MSNPWKNKIPKVEVFCAIDVDEAVINLVPYLEDNTSEHNEIIYFDGWGGLGASAVLKSLAEHPPPSLRNIFGNIIHIDCSKWKNRRTVQRTIAKTLKLPQHVMGFFDRQDENDDFDGVDEGSRVEIRDVGRVIHQALKGHTFLVIFHNGSNTIIDLNDFGIPRPYFDPWSNAVGKVLWTFRGRFRTFPFGLEQETEDTYRGYEQNLEEIKDNSSTALVSYFSDVDYEYWGKILLEEAKVIARNINKSSVTPELVATCCRYLLSLNSNNRQGIVDFDWCTHASNYWVCDGIIQDSQQHKAWEIASALQEEMLIEKEGFDGRVKFPYFSDTKCWVIGTYRSYPDSDNEEVETTSLFLRSGFHLEALHSKYFQRFIQLRVLKLYRHTFMFSSPPFVHCKNLRFLALDSCMDEPKKLEENRQEEEEKDTQVIEFFQRLWVLDICSTDWELTLYLNLTEKMATNIREINVKKGRIWDKNKGWTWRHLQNIHKLRVIEPTCPWKTESMDDFADLVNLELLDLSGNSTIRVLPSLLGATGLSTLILDRCVGLERIGPDVLPPSLVKFSLDAGKKDDVNKAKISSISMAGCARLVEFRLCGLLPNLEELNLSNTSVKTLNLSGVVKVFSLRRVILLGCRILRALLWPQEGMPNLMVLCIDTRGGTEAARSKTPDDAYSLVSEDSLHARVAVTDMRFLQSLMLAGAKEFAWNNSGFNLYLCLCCTRKDDVQNKEQTGPSKAGLAGSHHHYSPKIPKIHCTYSDINIDKATVDNDGSSARHIEPVLDLHVEIGEGINYDTVVTEQGIRAVVFLMNRVKSLLVQDNSLITTVIPERMMSIGKEEEKKMIHWSSLKCCDIKRCSKLDTVFATNYDIVCFRELETFSAADLLIARCIWSKGRVASDVDDKSFAKLQAIHIHFCPKLTFVLPLSWNYTLSSLQTLHIVYCGDLSQVFPVEAKFLNKVSTDHRRGVLEFPMLKHIHLHELPKLHQICEAKIFAPKLETIWVRGCWSLKRLPATADSRPVVDCEKDWWEKLEWDGKEARHHPSLFEPRHSKYYRKKNLLRGTVLR